MPLKNPEELRNYRRKYYEENREKIREHKRKYLEKNRDKKRERERKYREKNREKFREYTKKWAENNPDKVKETSKNSYQKHREKRLKARKEYYERNREKQLEYAKKYREEYPEKRRSFRRKRLYGFMPGFSSISDHLEKAFVGCFTCGDLVPTNEANVDHCHQKNVVRGILCRHCNSALGNVQDSIPRLEALIAYLKDPPALRSTPQHPVETSALTLAS